MDLNIYLQIAALIIALGSLAITACNYIKPNRKKESNQIFLKKTCADSHFDEATVIASSKNYIKPRCSVDDPSNYIENSSYLYINTKKMFNEIDYFLTHENRSKHLFILADSGVGKTSLILNYLYYNAQRKSSKRFAIRAVHLGSKDSDELLKNGSSSRNNVIFLDALDEDASAISNHKERIIYLMDLCRNYSKVVITCRTQFFLMDSEVPKGTGTIRIGSRKAGETADYSFERLYICHFNNQEVAKFIRKLNPFWQIRNRYKVKTIVKKIPKLSMRPMLLAYVEDLVDVANKPIGCSSDIYKLMIDAWLVRESYWVDKNELLKFSELLAVEMYSGRQVRKTEEIHYDEIKRLALQWKIKLYEWQIFNRSLLNRDGIGNYKFAHRSIMEFLFVQRMIKGDILCYDQPLTDQMAVFLDELIIEPMRKKGHKISRKVLTEKPLIAVNNYSIKLPMLRDHNYLIWVLTCRANTFIPNIHYILFKFSKMKIQIEFEELSEQYIKGMLENKNITNGAIRTQDIFWDNNILEENHSIYSIYFLQRNSYVNNTNKEFCIFLRAQHQWAVYYKFQA